MTAQFRARISSLGIRLLLPLVLVIGGVLAVYAVQSLRSTERHLLHLVEGEVDRSSGLIRRATHDAMLLNRLDDVQSTIERLAEGPEVAAIRVYDKEGNVVLSSNRAEIGERVGLEASPCSSCHPEAPTNGAAEEATERTRIAGEDVLRKLTVIQNEAGCTVAGCHDHEASMPVLGVLDVEMSMVPLDEHLGAARRQVVWTTLLLVLIIGGITAVIFRRLIYRPIAQIQEGARRIARGDLSTRIEVPGKHELASLAGDFNRMSEELDRLQAELTEWSFTLEEKVSEKTAQLQEAQGQVLHMEKMASLGKLSATVAHEINNPISGILTYSRLIEREIADQRLPAEAREELEHHLHLVQRECIRCGAIVQNLLAFARRSDTEPRPVNLAEVLEHSLMLVRHHLELAGIDLRRELPDVIGPLVADEGQLQQALVAVLVNAVEAMRDGGTLTVAIGGDDADVAIHVTDTGTGIPPEVQAQVFEPFFTTKQSESGSGLGLSVVYGIVHRHGGTIGLDSAPGRGTTVTIRLPRTPTNGDAAHQPTAVAAATTTEV